MTALAPSPRTTRRHAAPLADQLVLALATASSVDEGMSGVVSLLRAAGHLQRVEWWAAAKDGRSLQLSAASGFGLGRRTAFPVGAAGSLVLVGDTANVETSVARFVDVLRLRATEEQLAGHAARALRQNEALEDFAALVAHELKAALGAALVRSDTANGVADALALVDSILEVARAASTPETEASTSKCLADALATFEKIEAELTADVQAEVPMPPAALSVLLRNLVSNALAAKARHIRVSAGADSDRWVLHVDDDGVGLGAATSYAAGSGLGFGLCRRLAERFGGTLELESRPVGGTRATLVLTGGTP
jgi:signal transduction histidine kinase